MTRKRKREPRPFWVDEGLERLRDQPQRATRLREARLWLWRELQKQGKA